MLFDHDVSQPLVARKEPFVMDRRVASEFAGCWRTRQEEVWKERERGDRLAQQMKLAAASRWVRLGRKLGIGPKLD